jgi:lauroyl/myristoyl acyltransferase
MKIWHAFVERLACAASRRAYRYFAAMLRFVESCLPVPILALFLFPAAAVTAICELVIGKRHSTFRQLHHLAESARHAGAQWRRRSFAQVWTGRVAMCMVRLLRYWPGRLRKQRWRRRCQFVGLERLQALLDEGRPVVLATLHYGNLTELYHCIRSCGIGVAFLTARRDSAPPYRSQLDSLADCANGLEGVPRRIEVGHLNLSQVLGFLAQPNRVLAIPIEGHTKRDIMVRGPGYFLRAAPGALHLAGMTGAVVIPCLFSAEKYLRSTIRFGEPLADDVVNHRERHPLGYENILQQIGPWLAENPEQSAPELINAISFRQHLNDI